MQLCSTASPQVLAQLIASHAVHTDDLFPFFLHNNHTPDPRKELLTLFKTRPTSPSQPMLIHIQQTPRSRVLHVFPKEIWRNPSETSSPFSHLGGGFISLSHSPNLVLHSLFPSPVTREGDAFHGNCSLKQTDINNISPKPHKPAIFGSSCANITELLLSLEPCTSPSLLPPRPATKCLPVAPSCTSQSAATSSSSSHSSSR